MKSPRIIDTHTHLNFSAFRDDRDEVVERTLKEDVWLVNVGTKFDTSRRAVEIAEQYSDGVYACVGLHPVHLFNHHIDEEETSFEAAAEEFDVGIYKELVQRSVKVKAIGEFGLDYYRMPADKDPDEVKQIQAEVVKQHLILAREVGLPVMIHCRNAYEDLAALLRAHYQGPGNIHSFTGTLDEARLFLEMGYSIGINGIVTFDKTGRSEEVVKNIPLDRILLETDAPYLTPEPHRGKRNEPLYTEFVAEKVGDIKGVSKDEVMQQTTENARGFFNL